ncbi:hypothetical protein LGM58_42000, partial [Burkholderia contaminans]|nr:hypothetical protein [Burkholderia contaminans]MCA8154072.1 hypothetical protein [Burkholderia contaminans]
FLDPSCRPCAVGFINLIPITSDGNQIAYVALSRTDGTDRVLTRRTRSPGNHGRTWAADAMGGGGTRQTGHGNSGTSTSNRRCVANTIRSMCRTFIDFPYDRDLESKVPGKLKSKAPSNPA